MCRQKSKRTLLPWGKSFTCWRGRNSTLALENGEAREALHRGQHWDSRAWGSRLHADGTERGGSVAMGRTFYQTAGATDGGAGRGGNSKWFDGGLRKDNARLQEQLKQTEGLPEAMQKLQERLDKWKKKPKVSKRSDKGKWTHWGPSWAMKLCTIKIKCR